MVLLEADVRDSARVVGKPETSSRETAPHLISGSWRNIAFTPIDRVVAVEPAAAQ